MKTALELVLFPYASLSLPLVTLSDLGKERSNVGKEWEASPVPVENRLRYSWLRENESKR